jgi:uncharacterized protein YPO0396
VLDSSFILHPSAFSSGGFRLRKLEVHNWGTFDGTAGAVHTVRPEGRTTLLIGQNGSGKSTLVDALLTLLVRPVVRNYNVASGAHKQERDERTYVLGAVGRSSRAAGEEGPAEVQFLRPGGGRCSVLLACFADEEAGEAFTLAVLLYLAGDGRVEKVYCYSPGERSIAADCAGLERAGRLVQQMQARGFRATTHYAEYHGWFTRATGARPRAMDVFNQTVAVKDVHSLTRFIREHMLEARPWGEKVDRLLEHFAQLSEAHQALVRARRQDELLEPVARAGGAYRDHAGRLAQAERQLEAVDSFFRRQTVELFAPECAARQAGRDAERRRKEQLGRDLHGAHEEARRLRNEVERAVGERSGQIPLLIANHEGQAAAKREAARRWRAALREAGLPDEVGDAAAFAAARARLPGLLQELAQQTRQGEAERDRLVVERAAVARALREKEPEVAGLADHAGCLPASLAALRRRLCEELRLPESDLPFAAELVAVKPEEHAWQPSIEMVLRGFALSLLVGEAHYPAVSRYVERTRLVDGAGRGQRLVYLRVGDRGRPSAVASHPRSLVGKLRFREGSPLAGWVRAELAERFDYRCCESVEEFQQAAAPAMTRERHVKYRGGRHEKDDRDRSGDAGQFVLGWDNHEKRRRLAEEVRGLREQHDHLDERLRAAAAALAALRGRAAAAQSACETADYASIDPAGHEREVEALRQEQQRLEENNDAVRLLKDRLAEVEACEASLQAQRDAAVRAEGALDREIAEAERLIANARAALAGREADGSLARQAPALAELADELAGRLTAGNVFEQERVVREGRQAEVERLRRQAEPLRDELTRAMNRFLREFPQERADLEARPDYLDGFLLLREQLRREDLPRHEQRFRRRLDEKVVQELGLLHGAFQAERAEVLGRVAQLNESLGQLTYRPGTRMQLEARPVRDAEVTEFQAALRECLAGAADEERFVRVEKLLKRLREDARWREKVTDVRRWFDFAARELDAATGEERGYYEDSTGQSGGEKAKLAFTILVAAIAYQYDVGPGGRSGGRFRFVVVDEMFSRVDDQHAEYALELFAKFGLQLLIVAPLDAKALVTEGRVGCYLHVVKDARTSRSEVYSMTTREFTEAVAAGHGRPGGVVTVSGDRAG